MFELMLRNPIVIEDPQTLLVPVMESIQRALYYKIDPYGTDSATIYASPQTLVQLRREVLCDVEHRRELHMTHVCGCRVYERPYVSGVGFYVKQGIHVIACMHGVSDDRKELVWNDAAYTQVESVLHEARKDFGAWVPTRSDL